LELYIRLLLLSVHSATEMSFLLSPTSSLARRKQIAQDTLERAQGIVRNTPGASPNGIFIPSQMPALDPALSPKFGEMAISVINSDSYTAARKIASRRGPSSQGKIAVLNLASDELPGGGWDRSLSRTQVGFDAPKPISSDDPA
jgi:hypothetical protein